MNITKEIGGTVRGHKKSNLIIRIVSALVMLPIAIYVILIGGLPFFVLLSLLSILILLEWNGISEKKPFSLLFIVQAFCTLLILLQINFGSPYLVLSIASSIVSIIAASYLIKGKIIWALLGFVYVVGPSASFLVISENYGSEVILWMMIVIWSMDTGAYFVGKNIGGPKMSPKISPNKTWSGLVGGTITAMIFGLAYAYFQPNNNLPLFDNALILLLLSGFFAILSQIGDLAESAVKRKFEVKDSGTIIPGHGGVMDRLDGIIFVAPGVVLANILLYG